jgi:hypothetical protein
VPNNSWLSIGFGSTMQNTDMIAWFVKDSMGSSKDLYSEGYGAPDSDA